MAASRTKFLEKLMMNKDQIDLIVRPTRSQQGGNVHSLYTGQSRKSSITKSSF